MLMNVLILWNQWLQVCERLKHLPCVLDFRSNGLYLKANGIRSWGSEMCATHADGEDGWGGTGWACIRKGSNVLKVTRLIVGCGRVSIYVNATTRTLPRVFSCVALVFTDILWWLSGQWGTNGSSWSLSWCRCGSRTGSEAFPSFPWRTTLKLHLFEMCLHTLQICCLCFIFDTVNFVSLCPSLCLVTQY